MYLEFRPSGVCSRQINIETENGIVKNVKFIGGCDGNTSGISALIKGMATKDVIEKLKDIKCDHKNTSCPAELAIALEKMENK